MSISVAKLLRAIRQTTPAATFVGDDERGVVMTAPGLSGAPKVKYYSTTARTV